ncbi:hypothetical protein DVH05_009014 [Phytophthora capsici]|nr:hypothetical protein DVH05_009014 [Phytophthora capsici]
MDRVQDVVADVVATDAICCSVVQKFLFPESTEVLMKQSDTDAASLLEILASSSEFDRSEFRYTRYEDSTSSNEDGPLDDEENNANLDSAFDLRQEMAELHDERSAYSALTLCMDSIDMARRVLGPGVHNLRATKGTGVEYDLLRYLDKKLIAMTQNFGDLLANLQWTPSRSTCEALEALISEFCLQIVARLCDQLPSASSACIAGRLQLEAQLERFENCLKQQLLPEIARSITGEEGNENYIISLFSVVTELLVMTERITLVWTLAGHQKRGRLLQAQALEATTIKERKMAAKIAILEESNVELSAKYDVLLATNAGLDGSMEVKRKANPTLTHGIKLGAKSAIEMTLENQLTELKRINLEQNVELENIRADLSEARSKAESDAALLLSRTSELEHQLSSALEKACRAESEIVLQAATLESQAMLLKKAQTQRKSAEMRVEDISTNCAILVDKINIQTRQITGLENRILKDKQHSIEIDSSLSVAMQDRDELVLLLSQTEEALASALNREKGLQSQLLGPISRESEDMNRVRGELHEATLELASLREELAELLDHSTLQSTTIEALKLEVDDAVQRTRDIESERDDLMLQYQKEKCLLEQKEQECLVLSHQFTASLSKLERQQEIEREECMTIHEALQRQTCSFQKVQARQHSIKMDYCSTIRDLKRQLETLVAANTHEAETRRVTAKLHVQEIETQTNLSILNLEDLVRNLTNKLHECKQDHKSTIQNWIRAEMQCGVQRVCIQRLTSNLLEATESCKMQLCDTESSSLRKGIAQDSVSIPSESELLVNDHLSSLDTWFDDVISGNQEIPSLVNTAPDLAPIRAQNEDSTASSSLLKTLTDLSALTNELLVVCESASDSETHFNNSLAEKSDQQAQIPVGTTNEKRKVKQKEKPSNEVIQLR